MKWPDLDANNLIYPIIHPIPHLLVWSIAAGGDKLKEYNLETFSVR